MYTLNSVDIAKFDATKAVSFVEFWSQFFEDDSKDVDGTKIDYFKELNVGSDLSTENVRKLLRWKDPRLLTHPNKVTGLDNPDVVKVLAKIDALNQFRNDQITESDIRRTADEIFRDGIVWKAFLLHIAKPHIYPIADVNVLTVWSLHMGLKDKGTWQTYNEYCAYFKQIANQMAVSQTVENILRLKAIDNSLVVFGRFLLAYYRPSNQAVTKKLSQKAS
jgi:hypothetical protein